MTVRPRRVRVGFLNTHPIQYAAPLYRFINRSPDIEAVPIYLTDASLRGTVDRQFGRTVVWDIDLLGGADPIFVPGYRTREVQAGALAMPAPAVWNVVRRAALDALVISGHVQLANHLATLAARLTRIPVFYRAETHLGLTRSPVKRHVRRILMGSYYRLIDGFLAIGTDNRAFYRAMGVPERKLFTVPYAVDNERFIAASRLTPAGRDELRRSLGLRSDVPVVVYASKLTARKRPGDLLEATRRLRAEGLDFDLLVVGSGELETSLREAAASLPGPAPVFAGFHNQSQMPRLLAACTVFVLTSKDEPWGLIINEAMCAGLAIVASREIGAVRDLVHDGVNGTLVDSGDIGQLVAALRPLLASPERALAMGRESSRIIARWSYAEDLDGIRAALRANGLPVDR